MFNTCVGAIAADKFKLAVKISEFPVNFENPFKIGEKVEILGRFNMGGKKKKKYTNILFS